MKTATKKEIYEKYNIQYKNGKILSPVGWISEMLKEGNEKTGKQVYTFSLLPGTDEYTTCSGGVEITAKGSCACDCKGCYAKTGRYNMNNVKRSMLINTYLANNYLEFVQNAIIAQLESIGRGEVRIHAAGDFNTSNSEQYANMWYKIAKKNN